MKIQSLRISNILSFKYHPNIEDAEEIIFEQGLNIIIGENGSGKSTALEVLNFLFKRVLYKQCDINQEVYARKDDTTADERKLIITPIQTQSYRNFRLEPNWNSENDEQKIRIQLKLDEIDKANIQSILEHKDKLNLLSAYSHKAISNQEVAGDDYILDITLNRDGLNFNVTFIQGNSDLGYEYLTDYNFYKDLIELYNFENVNNTIPQLLESFTLISSYRNYHAFSSSISLKDQHPTQQIQKIRSHDYTRSLNANEQGEPSIFGMVRLRVAEKHFGLFTDKYNEAEREQIANELPFLKSINEKLKIINLKCKIKLTDLRNWQYSFEFHDLRRDKILTNINSLSAGQKAITHLVFESYGRGELKGGVVIIDEPEIHLHYQFQNEYMQVIRELNKEQECQYILVTHSEALINSSTINQVKRFALTSDGSTIIKSPRLTQDQRILIKILDNTRSTYAFFAKKVLLVEGDTDRYFFKSIIQEIYPELDQSIAILETNGKGGRNEWDALFSSFGLQVFSINDLDYSIELFYPAEKGKSLKEPTDVFAFRGRNPDWETKIDGAYASNIFVLKNGDLEHYIGIRKTSQELTEMIDYCVNGRLKAYLTNDADPCSIEIRRIMSLISD